MVAAEYNPSTDPPRSVKHLIDTATNLNELPPEYVLSQPPDEPVTQTAAIPVIDLSGLHGPTEVRKPIVDAICSACSDWGFFMIINHGIEVCLMEEMIKVSEEFHNLPLEEKMKFASDDVMHPIRYGTSLNTTKKHELHWRDFLRHRGDGYEEFLPSNPPNYRAVVKEYMDKSSKLCFRLFGALSEGLGLPQSFIEESLNGGMQLMASNYYPPCPEPARAMGLAAHTDHGPLTILLQNGIDGLQIKHGGQWVIVNQIPGALIVNVGDYIEILSNGRYKSVEHRASVNARRTRISIPSGILPSLTTVVAPASPLIKENNKIKYRPFLYEQYVRFVLEKVNRAGKSALEAIMVDETAEDRLHASQS